MRAVRRCKICPLVAVLAGLVMLARAWSTVDVFNDTADEPFHIAAAVTLMETGRLVHGVETPPVPRLVQGLALRMAGVRTKSLVPDRTIYDVSASFKLGNEILGKGSVPYWTVLRVARGATLLFAAIVLLYVYLLGRWAGGPVVGMFATIFCSADPTLIAHSALATSDAAAAAAFVAAIYHGLRWVFSPDAIRAIVAGVALGIAVGAKFSCLALFPILFVLIVWRTWTRRRSEPQLWRDMLAGTFVAGLVALVMLWACYLFDIGTLAESELVGGKQWTFIPDWLARLPIPMPSLVLGFGILMRHNAGEHAAYLFGEVSKGGWWYYFPVALAMKVPSALLLGAIAALALAVHRVRRRPISLAILIPIVLLLAITMTSRIQLGVRYLLPIIPLMYVLIALQLCRTRWTAVVMIVLIALSFIETAAQHPDYLAFHNVIGRAASRQKPALLDSNLDWGQDVARLARWLRAEHPNTPYEARIFCSDAAAALPGSELRNVNKLLNLDRGLLIVSKNVRYGLYPFGDPHGKTQDEPLSLPDVVHSTKPIKTIGTSIEVYEVSEKR